MAANAVILDELEDMPTPVLNLPLADMYLGPNRRFLPRVADSFLVRPLDGGATLEGIDISFGGLMCAGSEPVWPGSIIEVDIALPGETSPIPARGRVVELVSYRDRVAMRVRFEGMSAARRKQIALWMARRAQAV